VRYIVPAIVKLIERADLATRMLPEHFKYIGGTNLDTMRESVDIDYILRAPEILPKI
jgi:hypothetical protein